jgi:hypothetical protein
MEVSIEAYCIRIGRFVVKLKDKGSKEKRQQNGSQGKFNFWD